MIREGRPQFYRDARDHWRCHIRKRVAGELKTTYATPEGYINLGDCLARVIQDAADLYAWVMGRFPLDFPVATRSLTVEDFEEGAAPRYLETTP